MLNSTEQTQAAMIAAAHRLQNQAELEWSGTTSAAIRREAEAIIQNAEMMDRSHGIASGVFVGFPRGKRHQHLTDR